MKSITSSANPLYKELKQLATSTHERRKAGRTLLDGIHLTEAYLQHGAKPILCVASASALTHAEAAAVIRQCQAATVQCVVLPDGLYQALSQVEHGVGLLFVIETPKAAAPAGLTQSAVLLDNLQDPGNLGSILRSAAAAGIRQIYCSEGSASAWSPKVLRAGMGAHFILDIFEGVDLAALMAAAQIPVLATSSYATQSIYQVDLSGSLAWLFGHEGQGVAEDLLQLASQQVVIPHRGQMESLNVAAAAAVCFFEQLRQSLD
ncbi:TrmH family RNA methyltransferase [Collimonas silvisoli]|uniref:TrmH family RNA methyltransferase n=1 Tax=Collimonas silvisoli TaxID=2825884 RepID=UPI001B8B7967|nr:RNA methyltransferase [Collimonas silvisoli]